MKRGVALIGTQEDWKEETVHSSCGRSFDALLREQMSRLPLQGQGPAAVW